MNLKKQKRRFNYLMAKIYPPVTEWGQTLEKWEEVTKHDPEKVELVTLSTQLKVSKEDFLVLWKSIYFNRWRKSSEYNKKPIKIKKDNPNIYAGEEWELIGGGTKRKPRRVRKTAWKRFYKLFPEAEKQKVHKKPSGRVYR
jgi:hypothetical protein